MFCPKCGTELKQQENGALYCKNCNHFYKSHQNAGPIKQAETQKPEYSEQSQDFFYEEKPIKICPVCNKKQSVNNSMCVSCGYDFISKTKYIKPVKTVRTTNHSYANMAGTATSARKNKAYSAMVVLVTIFAILLVVAIISTALYCSAPVRYGVEYSMDITSNMPLPIAKDSFVYVDEIKIVFRPNNTYIMSAEGTNPVYGFYHLTDNNKINLYNSAYGITNLEIDSRDKIFVRNSTLLNYTSHFMSSNGLDVFLITATVLIGSVEIVFIALLCFLSRRNAKINKR